MNTTVTTFVIALGVLISGISFWLWFKIKNDSDKVTFASPISSQVRFSDHLQSEREDNLQYSISPKSAISHDCSDIDANDAFEIYNTKSSTNSTIQYIK